MTAVQRILRWDVPVDDQQHLIGAGPIVHVATRTPRFPQGDTVEVWTLEQQPEPTTFEIQAERLVQVVGTGHAFPVGWAPVGSAIALDGGPGLHVCEVPA